MIEWNNTALSTLERCGEQFRRRYLERDPDTPTPSSIRGAIVHQVAKMALKRKIGFGNDALPTGEEVRDTAATWFEREWGRQDVRLVPGDDEDGATALAQAKAKAKDFAVKVSAFHRAELAPRLEPIAVERRIQVRPKNSDLVIHGTLDLVTRDSPGPTAAPSVVDPRGHILVRENIRDLKTSEKTPPSDAAGKSQQLSMYGLVRYAERGALAETLDLDYLVRTPKLGLLKYVHQTTTRDSRDFEALVARLNKAVEAVKKGVFIPANESTAWWCSEKWCSYWTTCPFTRRSRRPTT